MFDRPWLVVRALRWVWIGAVFGAMFTSLVGCASLPPPLERPATQALPEAEARATALGRRVAALSPAAQVSGFRLVVAGEEAYALLAALADQAQRSLDLQYYLIRSDGASRRLLQRVRAAADRGVRVRLLVDDFNTAGQDASLLRLTQHPRIEVRLYNPFPAGRFSTMSRVLASLTDASRINQRMHNKMFVADNSLALTGGRNLGDAYFAQHATNNFLDLDVLVAGPAVRQLSATFDAFWNQPLAYPVGALVAMPPPDEGELAADAADLDGPVPAQALARALDPARLQLTWAPSRVLADKPSKIESEGDPDRHESIADDVEGLMRSAREEVLLISPYFVPGRRGVLVVKELASKGVRLRVLTNSLSTTDAPAVHIGYARYREALLQAGVELHELRRHLSAPRSRWGALGSSGASLHAKILVIDRRRVLVGSMNMDPRSQKLNSEMGVVIDSPAIALQLLRLFEEVSATSYRVSLDANGALRWVHRSPDTPAAPLVPTDTEPETSPWLRLGLGLLAPFAPDEML